MRRRTFLIDGLPTISVSKSDSSDICLYNKNKTKLIIVPNSEYNTSLFPSDIYTPVGVVVVPGKHNVYGDGSCAVMSLHTMHCSYPKGATNHQYMMWGFFDVNNGITSKTKVPYIGKDGSISTSIIGQETYGILPSDMFTNTPSPHDADAFYYSSNSCFIPSPFLTNENRNSLYYQTSSPSSTENALSDFNGVKNTDAILKTRTTKDYSSWLPDRLTDTDYPAASCCDMYYTDGTKQGDWYLPAIGELGYIIPKFNKIQTSFQTLINVYGTSNIVKMTTSNFYWSSTRNGTHVWCVEPEYGYIGKASPDSNSYCGFTRAFLRVK